MLQIFEGSVNMFYFDCCLDWELCYSLES